jgi:autotransporter-associated beta strand protein
MKPRLALCVLAALSLGLATMHAQVTWSGLGGDDDWSSYTNWLLFTPPADGDSVAIVNLGTGTSNLDYSVSLTGLNFGLLSGNFTLSASNGAILTIDGGDTISFGDNNTVNISAPIAGAGNLWLNGGTGTLTLTAGTPGQNTYSGSTQVYAGGTLSDGAPDSFSANSILYIGGSPGGTVNVNYNEVVAALADVSGGPGTLNLAAGTTLLINGGYSSTYSGVITGPYSATLDFENVGNLTLLGANPFAGTLMIGSGYFVSLGNGGTTGSIANVAVTGSGSLVFNHSNAYPFGGTLTNAVSVVQQGAGTTTLNGTNTYTGTTTVNAGTLQAGSTSAFGGAGGLTAVTLNGSGILDLNGYNTDIGSLTSASSSAQVLLGSGAVLSVDDPEANTVFAGNLHGNGGLTMNGYVLSLTGTGSDYTGPTTINAGTLLLDNPSGSATGDSNGIHISTGATLQIGNLDANGHLSTSTGIYDYGTLTFARDSGSGVFNNLIVGTGGVLKYGTYFTLIFDGGGASYSGTTVVYAGLFQDASPNAFSPNSTVQLASGTTVENFYNDTVGSLQDYLGSAGSVIINSGTTLTSNGLNYVSDFSGTISGGGAFAVADGVQGLSGNNTYSGGTLISGNGEIFVGSNTALGTGTVTFDGPGTELSPDANVTLANPIVLDSVLDNDDGANNSLTLTGQISGPSGITWCTPGTLTLTNNNTFMGGVDMREGNLVVMSNTAAGTGTLTLDTGASLTVPTGITFGNAFNLTGTGASVIGSGTIASPLTVSSAVGLAPTATPGGGPGTLTFSGGLTLASGGSINFQLYDATGAAGTGTSLVSATGGLDLTAAPGTFVINILSVDSSGNAANAIHLNLGSNYSWLLAASTSPITGFTGTQFVFNTGGFLNGPGNFSVSEVGDSLELNFTPAPEPATWALLAGGTLAIAGLSIRRRRLARA